MKTDIQKMAERAKKMISWNEITSTLNQIGFLESFDKPFVCLKTIHVDDIECIGLDQVVVDKIKEGMQHVSKVKSTILDEITIHNADDKTIVCTKILAEGKEEKKYNFSIKNIVCMNFMQVHKIVYIDVISKKYTKRNIHS